MNGTTISTLSRNNFNQLLDAQEDTKKMITSEEVSPSTHAYQKGNYLIYNNQLYKVTTAIAVGDALSTSTNIEAVNVGEELKATAGGSAGGEVITPPTMITSSLVYNASAQSPIFSGFDEDTMVISGNTATNVNLYVASVALKNANNTWLDTDDNLPKLYSWSITKAQPIIALNSSVIELTPQSPIQDITVTYTGDGEWVCSSDNNSIVSVSKISSTVCRVSGEAYGTPSITINATETSNYSSASSSVEVTSTVYKTFGVYWSGSSSPQMTRTDASANFSNPNPVMKTDDGWTTGSSPFDDIWPWSGMVMEERTGGTMVKIPKFWFKLSINDSTYAFTLQIANGPVEGFSVSPTHMDRGDGVGERDYMYVGRYHCAYGDYKSRTRILPQTNTNPSSARTAIHTLGSTTWQFDYATRVTIYMLYLVEFANWNSQAMIGYGCAPASYSSNYMLRDMGYTDEMPYHTGTDQTTRDTYGGTQYRYIEGLWDNCLDWADGLYLDSNAGIYAALNPANYSNTSYYTKLEWTRNTGTPKSCVFRVSSKTNFNWLMYPIPKSNTVNTYTCDGYYSPSWSGTQYPKIAFGGWYQSKQEVGLFYYDITISTSLYYGCRLIELP